MKILRGEYWFTPEHELIPANPEGDFNHEGRVMERIIDICCDRLGMDNVYETDAVWFRQDVLDDDDAAGRPDSFDKLEQSLAEDYGAEAARDMISLVSGSQMDARNFAMSHWSWIRISQQTVALREISAVMSRRVIKALREAYSEEYDAELPDDHPVHINPMLGPLMVTTVAELRSGRRPEPGTEVMGEALGRVARNSLRKLEDEMTPEFYKNGKNRV